METWYTTCTVLDFTGQNCTGLFTSPVSNLHPRVDKLCPGWRPTCNGTVLSRGVLSPEWDKNFDVRVPPVSKPIHRQLDPPAGEYLFVSMTIKKKKEEDGEAKLSRSLEFSLTEPEWNSKINSFCVIQQFPRKQPGRVSWLGRSKHLLQWN